CSFSLRCFGAHWHPLPFPTRRSSDLSLRTTDFYLIDRCGFPSAVTALYGDKDQRAQYFDGLRWSGGDEAVLEALKREEDKIQELDRKSTRLNSSHVSISYAVFCLKKK